MFSIFILVYKMRILRKEWFSAKRAELAVLIIRAIPGIDTIRVELMSALYDSVEDGFYH